jgi:hypothetical protein
MKALLSKLVLALAIALGLLGRAIAQDKGKSPAAEENFAQAFFLQAHQHDAAGAANAYQKVADDASAPETLRAEARTRLEGLREDTAAADFARLMPPDLMGYIEVVEPGEHIARILKMMGLCEVPGADKPSEPALPLEAGLAIPADFHISPALLAEIKKLRGAAVGVTAIDGKGKPSGVIVIHPGDCDLVRGLIETGIQLLEPAESIEGFKTWHLRDYGWVMLTHRLVLASDTREQLAAAVGRLRNPSAESLASREQFKRVRSASSGVMAYVDGQQIVKFLSPNLKGREATMIKALLDLEHFESAVATLSTNDNGVQLRAQVNLTPGHRNMAYALIRTAPISKRSLEQVPKGAAGVVILGLNPPSAVPAPQGDQQSPNISAMDIGREFFGNINELAAFALPRTSTSAGGLPEVGLIVVVNDANKSEALWNQVLSIVALAGARTTQPTADATIEGKAAHVYSFEGLPPIAVVRADDRGLVIGTQAAVAASLRAIADKQSILQDDAFSALVGKLTPETSKAVLIDAGRAMEVAASMSNGRNASELREAARMADGLKLSLVTDEAPNQLTIAVEATGLPKFRTLMPLMMPPSRRGVAVAK